MHRIVIIGCGGMGREAHWIAQEHNRSGRSPYLDVLGFLTSDAAVHGTQVHGLPVLGPESWIFDHPDTHAVIAIGNPRVRRTVASALDMHGVRHATLVHPSVPLTGNIELGEGSIVSAGAVLTTDLRIGRHAIINVRASVMHDTLLEDFATLAPGVTVAGHAVVEYGADLGANSCIIPQQRVGRGAIVGAGAVVTAAIPPNAVALGVPAAVTRTLPEDQWL